MVPKLHKKGASFKGASLYLLHDKGRAITSERVAWTAVHNIALDNAESAWRIMAATAMDQQRLKTAAGIKSTGRKSDKCVLHLSLSWHPDEANALTRQEMRQAASEAIHALGAAHHQCLIIAHNDEIHPHLHIMINRVNPVDGRMLSSSKEKLALSKWAESYERRRGSVLCEQRAENNRRRSQGLYTRATKALDRRAFEKMKAGLVPANQNRSKVERQIEMRRLLSQRGRALQAKQRKEWEELGKRHAVQPNQQPKTILEERAALIAKHARQKQMLRNDWRALREQGQDHWRSMTQKKALKSEVKASFEQASTERLDEKERKKQKFKERFRTLRERDKNRDGR